MHAMHVDTIPHKINTTSANGEKIQIQKLRTTNNFVFIERG